MPADDSRSPLRRVLVQCGPCKAGRSPWCRGCLLGLGWCRCPAYVCQCHWKETR